MHSFLSRWFHRAAWLVAACAAFIAIPNEVGACPAGNCGVFVPHSCENKPTGFPLSPPWAVASTFEVALGYASQTLHCSSDLYSLDFNMASGTSVYPAAPGKILALDRTSNAGYGRHVLVDHQNGYQSLYAHLSSVTATLQVGSFVTTGTLLGLSGQSGTTTPHLHFTLYRGARWAGDAAAAAIIPETLVGCYKNGNTSSTCRALVTGDDLTRNRKCGNDCAQCILTVRTTLLNFYERSGWDTSCGNYNAIVKNYCGPGVSVAAAQDCDAVAKTLCKPVCTDSTCGNRCTQCILNKRTDILPFYQQNGWDTSCSNRDNIVNNYCTAMSPAATANCRDLKRNACALFCDYVP